MANHQSAIKRIRQTESKKTCNKYFAKTTRTALKQIRNEKNKDAATKMLPKLASMLDRLAKKNLIHKNKASNLKSKLASYVKSL